MCLFRRNGRSTRLAIGRLLVGDSDGHCSGTSASSFAKLRDNGNESRNNWSEGRGNILVNSSRLFVQSVDRSTVSLVCSFFVLDCFRNRLGDSTTITQGVGNCDILGRFRHESGRLDSIVRNAGASSSGRGDGIVVSISIGGTPVDHAVVHVLVSIRGRGG
jgi:hypothetical protein